MFDKLFQKQKQEEIRRDLLVQVGERVLSDTPEAEILKLLEAGEALRFIVKGDFVVLTKGLNDFLIEKLGMKEEDFLVKNGEVRIDQLSKAPHFDYYLDENTTEEYKRAKQAVEAKIKAYLETKGLNKPK